MKIYIIHKTIECEDINESKVWERSFKDFRDAMRAISEAGATTLDFINGTGWKHNDETNCDIVWTIVETRAE